MCSRKYPRLLNTGKLKWDYVATRSLFPKTFGAAVKQKTRWIYGITMQSLHIKDILSKENKLSPVQKWALYKDWKSKFVNILVLPAYIILVYFFGFPFCSTTSCLSHVVFVLVALFRSHLRHAL